MSDDFTRRDHEFSSNEPGEARDGEVREREGAHDHDPQPVYRGDPWAEQQALGGKPGGCSGCLMGCGCGCLLLLLALAVGGVVAYFQCLKGEALVVSPETTVLTEPLKADGKTIDYFAAIRERSEPKDPADGNGFKTMLAAYGKAMFEPPVGRFGGIHVAADPNADWQYAETCKLFGLDPRAEPAALYESPNDYLTLDADPAEKKTDKKQDEKTDRKSEEKTDEKPTAKDDEVVVVVEENDDGETAEVVPGGGLDPEFEAQIKRFTVLNRLSIKPWTLDEQPKMKAWLDKVGPGLDVLRDAVAGDRYFVPMVRRNENELCTAAVSRGAIGFHETLSQAMRIRIMYRLGTGDEDGAWKDAVALLRLTRFLYGSGGSDPSAWQLLALASQTNMTAEQFLYHAKPTRDGLDARIADLEALPGITDRKTRLDRVRFTFLDAMASAGNIAQFFNQLTGGEADPRSSRLLSTFGFNWNIVTRRFNEQFDAMEARIKDKNLEEMYALSARRIAEDFDRELENMSEEETGKMVLRLLTVQGRSEQAGTWGARSLISSQSNLFRSEVDTEIRRQMLRTAFALERFKLEKKEYPDALAALDLSPPAEAVELNYEKTKTGYVLAFDQIRIEQPPPTEETPRPVDGESVEPEAE